MNALDPLVVGAATSYAIQCRAHGNVSNSVYGASDPLTAYVCQGNAPSFPPSSYVFQPSVGWYTANGTQSGYGQGQLLVTITNSQSAMLIATGFYTLVVGRAPSGAPSTVEEIVRIQLPVVSPTLF